MGSIRPRRHKPQIDIFSIRNLKLFFPIFSCHIFLIIPVPPLLVPVLLLVVLLLILILNFDLFLLFLSFFQYI